MKDISSIYRSYKIDEMFHLDLICSGILITFLFVVSVIIWATITEIDEIAAAKGEIEPEGYIVKIQHLDGGIVKDILVREGDLISKGQTLVRLNGAGIHEELTKANQKKVSLELVIDRLNSLIHSTDLDLSDYDSEYQNQINEQYKIYNDELSSKKSQQLVLQQQLEQKIFNYGKIKSNLTATEKEIPIVEEIYNIHNKIVDSGGTSRVKVLTEKKKLISLTGTADMLRNNLKEAEKQISEYKTKQESFEASYIDKLNKQLEEKERELRDVIQTIKQVETRIDRLEVTAQDDGIVKSIDVSSSQEVINPGETVLEVVPTNKPMIANIKIMPTDIGYVSESSSVKIKISSYDFMQHGYLIGNITYISPSTLKDKNGKSYYKALVQLEKNYLGDNPNQNIVLPGMIVQADITTGKKSIMSYLLKPIHRSVEGALHER